MNDSSTNSVTGPAAASVAISVNGERREVAAGTALDALVGSLTVASSGVAWPPPSTRPSSRARGGRPRPSPRATVSKSSPPSKEADPWPTIPSSSAVCPSAPG